MNALFVRQGASCSAKPRQILILRNRARVAAAIAPRKSRISTAAFQTKLGGGETEEETKTHDGSSPVTLRAANDTALRLEERAGRVYATAELAGAKGKDEDDFFLSGPPLPSGVFLAGAELRPGTSYLLSPGAEISFTDPKTGKQTGVTVGYQVSENDGIGGLGQMLARAMAAQASDEVRAKLDDVF
jgi:hypothetical protein